MIKLGIVLGVGASYNPHNHKFQGMGGTRQMDGYQGPIRSLAIDEGEDMTDIDIILSFVSEKIFILSDIMPKKHYDTMKIISDRSRFLSKYMQQYYNGKEKKRFPVTDPISIFISLAEPHKYPWMKEFILNKKLRLSPECMVHQKTMVDKLLLLYSRTKNQVADTVKDFKSLSPYDCKKSYNDYTDPKLRFWDHVDSYNITSTKNMSDFVKGRIEHNDLIYMMFRRLIKYCVQKEKEASYVRIKLDYNSSDYEMRRRIQEQKKLRKKILQENLEEIKTSIIELTQNKPYRDQLQRVLDREMVVG